MSWPLTLLFGLLTGFAGAFYGAFMAERSVRWLRISSFEGGSGYFVVFMILLAFIGSTITGVIVCRMAGGGGILQGFGAALATVFLLISLIGALARAQREVEPLVGGEPIDVAVEVRFPPGAERPAVEPERRGYVALQSGRKPSSRLSYLELAAVREENGRWIVPTAVPVHVSEGGRILSVMWEGETQFFTTPIPARPVALDADWSPWLAPYLGNLAAPASEPLPPPPPAHHVLPADDALTDEWLAGTALDVPAEVAAHALRVAHQRPDFVPALIARIRSADPIVARDAMYRVGEMEPPPTEAGEAVRERAAEVVRIAEAIDPAAEDSRDQLYAGAWELACGVRAAAFGLRRAGVDIRDALGAMGEAADPREGEGPHELANGSARIIAYFEQLDREGEASNVPYRSTP